MSITTTGYPMSCLGRVVLPEGKGDCQGLFTFDETTRSQLLAFVWCNRDRQHTISTCSSLANGTTISRMRWQQADKAPNADPTREQMMVPHWQPNACKTCCLLVKRSISTTGVVRQL